MGRRRLVRKEVADHDLAVQVAYLARRRPAIARRYLLAVEDAYQRLAAKPEIGLRRRFDEPELSNIRAWPVPGFRRYVIYYRLSADVLEVLRVLHTARDVTPLVGGSR